MALISYDIDFKKMVQQLLGTILRKTKRVAWLTACLKPLRNLHDLFLSFTDDRLYEVRFNGQTIILERLLIEQFGPGIFIENHMLELNGAFIGENDDNGFFIGVNADNSQFIDVTYSIGGVNFTVYVPAAIVFIQSEMEAIINKYKMFGTTYEIVII